MSSSPRLHKTSDRALTPATALVFIDPNVAECDRLRTGIVPNAKAIVLKAQEDGVEQITDYLSCHRHQNIQSLHFVTHGSPGCVQLGNIALSWLTVNDYAQHLCQWKTYLRTDASLVFYGCEVAAQSWGEVFIERLLTLTGLNVVASTQKVGNPELGGSWEFNVNPGNFKSAIAFKPEILATYSAVLEIVRVSVNSEEMETGGFSFSILGFKPDISEDGRFVVFESDASNLVAGDTNLNSDIFVRDRDPDEDGIFDEANSVTRRLSMSSG